MRDYVLASNLNKWETVTDWFLFRTQLTPPHSTPNLDSSVYFHLCPSPGPSIPGCCRDFWKSLFCLLHLEHLIELVHDIFDRGFVRELVDHYGYHVSEGVCVKIISESCPAREKLAPHWPQLPGDTRSAWKQQNARGIKGQFLFFGNTLWCMRPR